MSEPIGEDQAITPVAPITSKVALDFCRNLALLGMPPVSFEYMSKEHAYAIEFDHPFFVIRFFDLAVTRINMDFTGFVGACGITFDEEDFPPIRKGIARLAKKNKGMKEIDPMESEIAFSMNKIAHVLINEMDSKLDFDHPGMSNIKNSVSPENQEKLTVLVALLPNLIPRELGGAVITFKNSTSVLRFDFPDGANF